MDWRATFESKLLPLLGAVLSDSVRDAGTFRFDKRKPQQLTAVGTYCSIIELTHGESSRQVHSFLNTGAVMRYEAHRKTLDLLRNEYSKA